MLWNTAIAAQATPPTIGTAGKNGVRNGLMISGELVRGRARRRARKLV